MDIENVAYTNIKTKRVLESAKAHADDQIEEALDALTAADVPTSDSSTVQAKLTSYATTLSNHSTTIGEHTSQLADITNNINILQSGLFDTKTATGASVEIADAFPALPITASIKTIAVQMGTGTPSKTNIRPISAHADVLLTVGTDEYTFTPATPICGMTGHEATIQSDTGAISDPTARYEITGAESWAEHASIPGCFICSNAITGVLADANAVISMCSHYNPVAQSSVAAGPTGMQSMGGASNPNRIIIKDTDYSGNLAGFKAYLAAELAAQRPVAIVYRLTTARTETITAQQVTAPSGTFTASHNGNGSVTIVYRTPQSTSLKEDVEQIVENQGTHTLSIAANTAYRLSAKKEHDYTHPLGGAVALSFDGGYASQYVAAQILHANGQHATFYILNMFLNSEDSANGETGITSANIVEMEAMGHEIGSHSMTHPNFTSLSEAQMIAEIEGSIAALKVAGIKNIGGFAYPIGLYNDATDAVTRRYFPYARKTSYLHTIPIARIDRNNMGAFLSDSAFIEDGMASDAYISIIKSAVLDAKSNNRVLPMYIHSFKTFAGDDATGEAMFREFVDYCKAIGMPIVPLISVLKPYNLASVYDWNFENIDLWTLGISASKYSVVIDDTKAFAKSTSMKITPNGSTASEAVTIGPAAGMQLSVFGGQSLSISYRLNIATAFDGVGISMRAGIYTLGVPAPADVGMIASHSTVTDGWITKSVNYTVPEDVYIIRPYFVVRGSTGEANIDMLEVIDLDQNVLL